MRNHRTAVRVCVRACVHACVRAYVLSACVREFRQAPPRLGFVMFVPFHCDAMLCDAMRGLEQCGTGPLRPIISRHVLASAYSATASFVRPITSILLLGWPSDIGGIAVPRCY